MGARFAAAGDMQACHRVPRRMSGGEAGGIAARIDAGAHAGRRADTGEDVEARIGGIGDETECLDVIGKSLGVGSGNAGEQQRAPGRGAQVSVAVALRDVGQRVQRIGFDAAERQPNAEGASCLIS